VHRRFVALAGFGFDAAVFLCDRQRRNRKRDGDHGSPHKLHHESILSETWYSPRLSTKEETCPCSLASPSSASRSSPSPARKRRRRFIVSRKRFGSAEQAGGIT